MLDAETWAIALYKSDEDFKVIPCQPKNICFNLSIKWFLDLLLWSLIMEKTVGKVKVPGKSVNYWLTDPALNTWHIRTLSVLNCDEIEFCNYEVRIVSRTKDRCPVLAELTFLALPVKRCICFLGTIIVSGIAEVLLKETNDKWPNLSLNGFFRLRLRIPDGTADRQQWSCASPSETSCRLPSFSLCRLTHQIEIIHSNHPVLGTRPLSVL